MKPETWQKLENFFSKYRLIKYKEGEIIYRPDDSFSTVAFIKSGYARLYSVSSKGQEVTIQIFKPVFYFSLIYALTDAENKYYFESVTDMEVWTAPKEDVLNFIKSDPELMFELTKHILTGFKDILENMESIMLGDASDKIVSIILSLSKSFGQKTEEKIIIDVATTHKIIASLTGLTRETVSYKLKQLENNNLISFKGKNLVIENLAGLSELL